MSLLSSITGTGLVSALGEDLPSTWRAMCDGQFIRTHARAKLDPAFFVGSRLSGLAARAAREAVASAGWSTDQLLDPETAIVFGTSKGDIGEWIAARDTSDKLSAARWSDGSFGIAKACDDVCTLLGRPAGAQLTISAACASGLQALIRADLLLRSGTARRVLVVAAEASIHPLFLASFARLGVLATGDEPARPFDQNRTGFRMSEAAAAVTLEQCATPRRDEDLQIAVTAMAGDASNIVAGDPQSRVLHRMLTRVFEFGPVDVIHAHGTGTRLNDQSEAEAINTTASRFGVRPSVFSHKGALGHSLGASGLVSVVLASAAHRESRLPPMTTTASPMKFANVNVDRMDTNATRGSSLVLANGFGGPQTAVLLMPMS